jgi:hypothetical protein
MQFRTTAAYLSGGVCGHMWMPNAMAGKPLNKNARGPWGFFDRFTEPASFRDALLSLLSEEGGDFQDAAFTADTVFRIERRRRTDKGYEVHVWEREVAQLPDCADLVNCEAYTGDFMPEDY